MVHVSELPHFSGDCQGLSKGGLLCSFLAATLDWNGIGAFVCVCVNKT